VSEKTTTHSVRAALEEAHARLCSDGQAWQACERIRGALHDFDALIEQLEALRNENSYLRQFENPGEVAALADQINEEQLRLLEWYRSRRTQVEISLCSKHGPWLENEQGCPGCVADALGVPYPAKGQS
jgi:hypothetical protein